MFTLLAGLISTGTITVPAIKKYLLPKQNTYGIAKLLMMKFIYYSLYSLTHVASMLLIMSYNGGVLITMICFMAVAYCIWGSTDHDSNMPINCCAQS